MTDELKIKLAEIAQLIIVELLPGEDYGENAELERVYNLLEEIKTGKND